MLFLKIFTPRRFQIWFWSKSLLFWTDRWFDCLLAVNGNVKKFEKLDILDRIFIERVKYKKNRAALELDLLEEDITSKIKRLEGLKNADSK